MKTAGELAIDSISRLPDEASWEDILHCLYVQRKIEEGIKAANLGLVDRQDDVKKLIAGERWR